MICKHCEIESSKDEGVEVVRNEPITNEKGLVGQLTEKRLYLSRFVSITSSCSLLDMCCSIVDYRCGSDRWFRMFSTSRKKPVTSIRTPPLVSLSSMLNTLMTSPFFALTKQKISSFAFLLCIEYTVSVDLISVACLLRFEMICPSQCERERVRSTSLPCCFTSVMMCFFSVGVLFAASRRSDSRSESKSHAAWRELLLFSVRSYHASRSWWKHATRIITAPQTM